ncbi:MAG: PAS domain S-box protein [Desulfarculus sp.]|nr:PAS domain S-box protein [Desulfarculus sp.]
MIPKDKTEAVSLQALWRPWRGGILDSLYLAGVILGGLVLAVSIYPLHQAGKDWVLWLDGAALTLVLAGYVFRRQVGDQTRACLAVLVVYVLGVALLWAIGPLSGGPIWLFSAPILTSLLLGRRMSWLVAWLLVLTLVVFGWLVHLEAPSWVRPMGVTTWTWAMMGINFIFLNVASNIAIGSLISYLSRAMADAEAVNRRLREESERRNAAETALRESEERYRMAFEMSPDSININRFSDGLYLDVNQGFTQLTGFTREEVLGRTAGELGIWADKNQFQKFLAVLEREGQVTNLEADFRKKDGGLITGLTSTRWLTLGGVPCLLSITRDISELRKASQELARSEERHRRLLESLPYGLVWAEVPSGRVLLANDHAWRMFDLEAGAVADLSFWDLLDPAEHELARERLARQLSRKDTFSRGVYTGLRKDGSRLRFEITYSVIEQDGRTLVQGFIRDVTEVESLEQQLRHAQKMEAVGTLSSGIAHDFNNILQAMGGFIQLLQIRCREDRQAERYLDEIKAAVERASGLVRRLLTFSRKMEPKLEPVDLNLVVAAVGRLLEHSLPKMISLEVSLAPGLPPILGDWGQLEQVLLNLGANASDAMPEGGRLTLATDLVAWEAARALLPNSAEAGDYLRLSVGDTGQGIDEPTQKKMFEPFFTTKPPGKGTGLGLAVAYGIVQNHGGYLTCQSRVGEGTVFNLFFLARHGQRVRPPHHDLPTGESGQRVEGAILVVDDEAAVLDSAHEYLSRCGYQVFTASSGERAEEILARPGVRVDLVLLDLGMPGMGGLEFLRRLRAGDQEIKVMVASGYAVPRELAQELRDLRASFTPKPYPLAEMSQRIARLLAGESLE